MTLLCPLKLNNLTAFQGVHLVCKTWEPYKPLSQVLVVLGVPSLLTTFLAPHFAPAAAFVLTYTVYYATLCTSIALYRLSPFHPFYRYPGPVLCKLSQIWFAWVASGGKQHLWIQQLHEQYGDVVRIGKSSCDMHPGADLIPLRLQVPTKFLSATLALPTP